MLVAQGQLTPLIISTVGDKCNSLCDLEIQAKDLRKEQRHNNNELSGDICNMTITSLTPYSCGTNKKYQVATTSAKKQFNTLMRKRLSAVKTTRYPHVRQNSRTVKEIDLNTCIKIVDSSQSVMKVQQSKNCESLESKEVVDKPEIQYDFRNRKVKTRFQNNQKENQSLISSLDADNNFGIQIKVEMRSNRSLGKQIPIQQYLDMNNSRESFYKDILLHDDQGDESDTYDQTSRETQCNDLTFARKLKDRKVFNQINSKAILLRTMEDQRSLNRDDSFKDYDMYYEKLKMQFYKHRNNQHQRFLLKSRQHPLVDNNSLQSISDSQQRNTIRTERKYRQTNINMMKGLSTSRNQSFYNVPRAQQSYAHSSLLKHEAIERIMNQPKYYQNQIIKQKTQQQITNAIDKVRGRISQTSNYD